MATGQEVAARWRERLSGARAKITAGVEGVQRAPGESAAAQVEKWAANTLAAKNKWAQNVKSVTLAEWRQAMIEKGIPRIAQGAQAAEDRMTQFFDALLPLTARIKEEVRKMPKSNIDESLARVRKSMEMMRTLRYQRRR